GGVDDVVGVVGAFHAAVGKGCVGGTVSGKECEVDVCSQRAMKDRCNGVESVGTFVEAEKADQHLVLSDGVEDVGDGLKLFLYDDLIIGDFEPRAKRRTWAASQADDIATHRDVMPLLSNRSAMKDLKLLPMVNRSVCVGSTFTASCPWPSPCVICCQIERAAKSSGRWSPL